jgi:alanyl aminopeptidase
MTFLRAVARTAGVLVLAGIALPVPSSLAKGVRLGETVTPVSQAVELRLDPATAGYTGSTSIRLNVAEETSTFRFHAEAMDSMALVLGQGGRIIPVTWAVGEKGVVTCTTEEPLAPGSAVLDIAFADDFNTDAVGLYRMDKDGIGYAFTQFEADDAREAFPCWDEPVFKIPYRITLSVPEGQTAVTNTPVETETAGGGWKTVVFAETKPLPSYLLAIAAGPLETVEIPGLGVPGRVVTVRGGSALAGTAVEMTPPLLRALEEWFGRPYPYEKCDLIAIPEYWPGAMENPGAITYADRILLLDPDAATVAQKRQLARVTAHELAHMWFGDLVTMEWWDDLWLNESFADWMGDKIADRVFPEHKRGLSTAIDSQRIMVRDALPSTTPIRRPVESTDNLLEDVGLAYDKGKSVLGMFEQWLGPEKFQQGVRNYINANAWGNATADDLWTELGKVSGKGFSRAMAGFIEQPGLPFISVESRGGGVIRLRQSRFHTLGSAVEPMLWQVPVGLRFTVDGKTTTRTVLLEAASQDVDLGGEIGWVFPQADGRGYYRWTLSPDLMAALAGPMTGELDARERIACLGNFGALLLAGEMDGGQYLATLNRFAGDSEPLVMTALLDALNGVKEPFVTEDLEEAFALYVRQTLRPALDRCGLRSRPGEDETLSLLRSRLIAWLGDEGRDERIAAFAGETARAYLDDPASVDPAVADACLRLAAQTGDRALFDELCARAEGAATPTERGRYLGVLGSFRDPAIQEAALRYALEGPVRPTEMLLIPRRMDDTNARQDRRFRWMTENFDAITGRLPDAYKSFMPFMAGGCSEKRMKAATAFFSDPEHQGPATGKQMARVTEQVTDCVGLREREGEAAARYLQGFHREP